ncbi:RecB family exonuclease [Castellaniella sp. UC4442_H9]
MNNVAIRASSLGELFDCPARWHAKHILGLRTPTSFKARLGTAVHAGTAAFDAARLDGSPITVDDAAGALVDTLYRNHDDAGQEEVVDWEGENPGAIERIGLSLHTSYCTGLALEQEYVAVELHCEALEFTDLGLTLTGTTDRVRRTPDGQLGITDLKTGATAVAADGKAKTSGHGPQLGVYSLLAERALGEPLNAPAQIIGMQTGKAAKAQRIGVGEVQDVRHALVGDADSPGLLEHASRIIHSGSFYGNPRSMLCSPKFCPIYDTCKFRG